MGHMEEKKSQLNSWVNEHTKDLVVLGLTAVVTFLVSKKMDSIKGIFTSANQISVPLEKIEPLTEKIAFPAIPRQVLDNLTGNKLTPTGLGNKVFKSAQAINKKIVAAGLATKLPNGDYSLTEAGRFLGEHTTKNTSAGHFFSNIEWDEKTLEVIFNPEELLEIAKKQKIVHEILSRGAK